MENTIEKYLNQVDEKYNFDKSMHFICGAMLYHDIEICEASGNHAAGKQTGSPYMIIAPARYELIVKQLDSKSNKLLQHMQVSLELQLIKALTAFYAAHPTPYEYQLKIVVNDNYTIRLESNEIRPIEVLATVEKRQEWLKITHRAFFDFGLWLFEHKDTLYLAQYPLR